ncbi:dystrophia myotonica WD repeat-containing protein-like [Prunus yedoensis var. nudiflora]|uniref:Dystrophia myotonica WD repeat-containing protein-like n=1 Tax=Prunus yedoensis var. nudiflora TaxID=2094558 RepID=A0A314ZV02_PRUYE|nr:dystrophia myotonica WD repeat-containing protein-like [Prunus yedoensis var. nudiflora]
MVIYAFLTTQKSNLYAVAKVTTVLSCVALGDGMGETIMYRFGSVGQDTQLLLWDLEMDEIVVPLRRCPPGGSPIIVLEASHLIGTMHFQWVLCSLLQACEMFQKSHHWLLTVYTLNPSLA